MELAGYSINIVTATIGAVSIGIGIDFAIHYTMRYREEFGLNGDRHTAVRRAGEGTGVALLSSASSSAVGFFILSFAPMPMFAVYGLLTAVMITMAAMATLLVLPSLLVAVTKDAAPQAPDPDARLLAGVR
jgi:predicted RND superfamily exporter protein